MKAAIFGKYPVDWVDPSTVIDQNTIASLNGVVVAGNSVDTITELVAAATVAPAVPFAVVDERTEIEQERPDATTVFWVVDAAVPTNAEELDFVYDIDDDSFTIFIPEEE